MKNMIQWLSNPAHRAALESACSQAGISIEDVLTHGPHRRLEVPRGAVPPHLLSAFSTHRR